MHSEIIQKIILKTIDMKKIFQFALLALLSIAPCYATQVDVKLQHKIHNGTRGGARMPALQPVVTADVTDNVITTTFTHFSGIAYAYICDMEGNVIFESYMNVVNQFPQTIPLDLLEGGEYTIHYIVNNFHFVGEFTI